MTPLPHREHVVYPSRDTGRQSSGHPEPDPDLLTLLNAHRPAGIYALAMALQEAGYTRPTPITTTQELAGLAPRDILSDRDGALWSADSIGDRDFQTYGPWTLERRARRTIITTEETS